jgi:aminocarboxymuconate-semialdehyde decarboxylase
MTISITQSPGPSAPPGLVDFHSHVYPRLMIEQYKKREQMPRIAGETGDERFIIFPVEQNSPERGRPVPSRHWDLDQKIAFMDAHGISHSVVSIGNPWTAPFAAELAVPLASRLNDFLVTMERESNGRLLGLGVVPEDVPRSAIDGLAAVAERADLRGIVIGSRLAGHQLDAAALTDFWRVAEEAGLVVMLHPHYGLGLDEMGGFGRSLSGSLGFPFETTLALCRLAFAGVLDRHPRLKLVAAHGGGVLPYLMGRIDAGWRGDKAAQAAISIPPSEYLSRIYVDGLVFTERALRAAVDFVGPERVVFGTDHPFRTDPTPNVAALRTLGPEHQRMVSRANALQLLGLSDDPSATPEDLR